MNALGIAGLALAYVLVPNAHHALLAGVPLSLVGAAALVLALVSPLLPSKALRRAGLIVAGLVLIKSVVALALPAPGFSAEYFPNDRLAGPTSRRVDRVLDFDAKTFPREFLIVSTSALIPEQEKRPFSVVWRGVFVLREPSSVAAAVEASEPVAVTIDGAPPGGMLSVGAHEVRVVFSRKTEAPPALRVRFSRPGHEGPVAVFTASVSPAGARFAWIYARASVFLDLVVLLILAAAVARGIVAALREPARRAPFRVAAVAVMALWFVIGAARTGPHLGEIEFLDPRDDWNHYEIMARRIAAGDIANSTVRAGVSTFLYPYFVAGLHFLFGERLWPLYFAQHLTLGLSCVLLGLLGKRLFTERLGVLVLLTATATALLDVNRWYVIRLLSENLALLVVPAAFLVLQRYLAHRRIRTGALAGVMLGMMALTRMNLLPFALAALGLVVLGLVRGRPGAQKPDYVPALAVIGGFALTYGLLPLREYLAFGAWAVVPANSLYAYTAEGFVVDRLRSSPLEPLRSVVLPNVAYLLGYPKFVMAQYSIRPHWFLLWVGYVAWLWRERRRWPDPTLGFVHLYIAVYAALMLITAPIWGYGFRLVLALSFVLSLFLPGGLAALGKAILRRQRS